MMANIVQQLSVATKRYDFLPLTFWTMIDIDYKTNISQPDVKSLADLSLEKLLSDVYLVYNISHLIPEFLHHLLLQKALTSNRVLSIIYLLKCYPKECFHFPIPSNLNNWSVFFKQYNELDHITNSFKRTTDTVIHTFFRIINNSISSQIQVLDMNEASIETSLLIKCLDSIILSKTPPQRPYLLKTGLIITGKEDLKTISAAKMAVSISAYLKLKVTGLHVYNPLFFESFLLDFLTLLQHDELQHFSIDLCLSRYNDIFPYLARYHYMQSLSLTYVKGFESDGHFLSLFSKTLNSLTNLKHLCLRGSCLSNCLRTLIKQDCKTDYLEMGEISRNCCTLHRGKLEYLDLASCRIKSDDLLCLIEFSQTKILKYLNLSGNTVNASQLSETIKRLGSSLVVLDVDSCFSHNDGLQELLSALEYMLKLKSINMRALPIRVEDLHFLSIVVKKMPELRQIFLDQLFNAPPDFCDYYKYLMSESKVNIFWYPVCESR